MQNKKSQIQIFETVAVLVIFFILLGIGFIFYTKVARSNIQADSAEIAQSKSVSIAQRVMFLPELECSEDNVPKENCIDTVKLESAKTIIEDNKNLLYYYDLFEFSQIEIKEIYPENNPALVLYSKSATDYKNKFETRVPITLYDPVAKINKFGMIKITTQTK